VAKTSEPEISKERAIASILRQFSLKLSPDHTGGEFRSSSAFKASKMSALRSTSNYKIQCFCINLYLLEYIKLFAILQWIHVRNCPFRREKYP